MLCGWLFRKGTRRMRGAHAHIQAIHTHTGGGQNVRFSLKLNHSYRWSLKREQTTFNERSRLYNTPQVLLIVIRKRVDNVNWKRKH